MSTTSEGPYSYGTTVTLSWSGTVAGVLTDPGAIVLTVKAPNGSLTTPTPVHDSVGLFHYDLIVAQSGAWHYRFVTTGSAAGAEEGSFAVNEQVL